MSGLRRGGRVVAGVWISVTGILAQDAVDPAAAERQYRLAQRLGAERSADATAAFQKVVALDPNGPLADDALVDQARLWAPPDWPEEVGDLTASRASAAAAPLKQVVTAYPNGDRAFEARYRLALIALAPLPGRDAGRARRDLIRLAADTTGGHWADAARYALGVLDEQGGARDLAAGSFARILVERPESDVAPRARAGFGRTLLAARDFGGAAGWFQDAIESGAPPEVHAADQRELAVEEVLRIRDPARRWSAVDSPLHATPTSRGATLLASTADGGLVVFDRRAETLLAFDAAGRGTRNAPLDGVTALAVDPYGRIFVATKDRLMLWGGPAPSEIVALRPCDAPAAVAIDASGAVWLADRKGDRVFRWEPGATSPSVYWESRGAGVSALAVTGGRVIAAEAKTGQLVVVAGPGADLAFGDATFRRPIGLAVDAAGRVSVLDAKEETVTRLTPTGEKSDTLSLVASGVSRPLAIASAPDGTIRILDGASGAVSEAP
jgi:sugar lactone lactonase YvrE